MYIYMRLFIYLACLSFVSLGDIVPRIIYSIFSLRTDSFVVLLISSVFVFQYVGFISALGLVFQLFKLYY